MNRTNIGESTEPFASEARRGERARRESESEHRRVEVERLREAGRNLGAQIEEQVRKRPYVVLGAAVGIGFVAGSLFGSRLGQMLLAAGVGYMAKDMVGGEGFERLQEGLERLTGEVEERH